MGGTAGIKTLPARVREALQGIRQVRLQDQGPRWWYLAVPEELLGSGGGLQEHRQPLPRKATIPLIHRKTIEGETDRRRERLYQR